jgi:hypothetical protein
VRDLEARGFLVQRGPKTLTNNRKLLEQWVARFPEILRPRLLRHRYQADRDRLLGVDPHDHSGYSSGEMADRQLTGSLKPEYSTLYVAGDEKPLLTKARMGLDTNGNTEILRAFWNVPLNERFPDVVLPLLAYADLMAMADGRNLETASLIYDKFLEPLSLTRDGRSIQ